MERTHVPYVRNIDALIDAASARNRALERSFLNTLGSVVRRRFSTRETPRGIDDPEELLLTHRQTSFAA